MVQTQGTYVNTKKTHAEVFTREEITVVRQRRVSLEWKIAVQSRAEVAKNSQGTDEGKMTTSRVRTLGGNWPYE